MGGCGGNCQVTLSSPVNITFSDRVGLYTSSANQLSIPFQYDHTASLYYSTDVVVNNSFTLSQSITVDDSRWRRSFRKYVVFCQTPGLVTYLFLLWFYLSAMCVILFHANLPPTVSGLSHPWLLFRVVHRRC